MQTVSNDHFQPTFKKNSGSSLKYCYFKATNTTYHWTPVLQHLYDSLILMTILQVAV